MTPLHGDYSGYGEVVAFSPSRENAAGAIAMIESFYATVERIETEVIVVVDANDPQLAKYEAIPDLFRTQHVGTGIEPLRPDPPRIMVVEGGSLTKATNEAVARIWDEDIIIGHVGDDHRFVTPGWDSKIRDVLLAAPGVAYAYDGFRSKWASAWWTNSIIPRTLGWLAVPGSMHLTIDDVFMDIGAGLATDFSRLHYLGDVLIEHLHPAGGKVEWRPIVKGHYEKGKRAKEEANYARYIAEDFEADIAKLQTALGLPLVPPEELRPGVAFRRTLGSIVGEKRGPTPDAIRAFAGSDIEPGSAQWLRARKLMRQGKPWTDR
jgi:hypothetical protein